MRFDVAKRARLALLFGTLAAMLTLSSCAGVLDVIEDRLPPPSEVEGGIKFNYYSPSARQVTLAGNFNNWGGTEGGGRYDPAIDPLSDPDSDGIWSIVVPLPPGRYQYKFVIDGGVRWEVDPNNPDTAYEGGFENSLIIVPPTIDYTPERITGTTIGGSDAVTRSSGETGGGEVDVELTYEAVDAGEVYVAGTFNNWSPTDDRLEPDSEGVWRITLSLEPGEYEYKFVVDGTWVEDPNSEDYIDDPYGGRNSVLIVE